MTSSKDTLVLRKSFEVDTFTGKVPSQFRGTDAPPTSIRSLGIWLFVVGFGLFGGLGAWIGMAQIQSAVLAGGSFEMEGDLQVVDHLEGGIIREIHVREGEEVEAGQILASLDGTRVQSQLGILESQLAAALARQSRLEAEAARTYDIEFPEELTKMVDADPNLSRVMRTQRELLMSNLQADRGQVQIFEERIAQLNTRLKGLEVEANTLKAQLALIQNEVTDLKALFKKGLVPKARLIARQEDEVEVVARIGQRESQRLDVLEQISEVQQRQFQVARERRMSIASEEQTLTENIFDLRQRLANFEEVRDRLAIRAPIAGHIVGFEANTIGSVVAPGERLMQIVPRDAPYIIEAQVATSDIDEVQVGSQARVRLSAYSFRKTPPIHGEVTHVSADSFYNSTDDVSFYRIHVKVPTEELDALPNVTPQPGMPVQVMVATGEQTVLTYLLDPVVGALETAMLENE